MGRCWWRAGVKGAVAAETGGPGERWWRRPERLFLLVAAVWGLGFVVLTPPFQVPDENRHFYRAYQLVQADWVGCVRGGQPGGFLPTNVVRTGESTQDMLPWAGRATYRLERTRELLVLRVDRQNQNFARFASAAYSPVAYVPEAIAIGLGSWADLPPIVLMYLGRLANLACWIALMAAAIRTTPVFRWVFFALALTPMSLIEGASLSADSMTNGLAFLTIASFLRWAVAAERRLRGRDVAWLVLLTTGVSLCKHAYFLLVCLYFLIPPERAGSRRAWAGFFGLLVAVNLAALGLWAYVMRDLAGLGLRPGAAPAEQIRLILNDPWGYVVTVAHTVVWYGRSLARSFVGVLGWTDTYLPDWHWKGWLAVLVGVSLLDGRAEVEIRWRRRVLGLAVAAATILGIVTALYIYWNDLASPVIRGWQGRYVYPVAPLLFLVFYQRRLTMSDRAKGPALAVLTMLSLSVTLGVLVRRFYG